MTGKVRLLKIYMDVVFYDKDIDLNYYWNVRILLLRLLTEEKILKKSRKS